VKEFGDGRLTSRSHAHRFALQSRCWPVKYPAARIGARIRTCSPLVHVRRARAGAFFGWDASATPPAREAIDHLLAVRHLALPLL
jgi:hypothetical protein